ncbi:hypothetical protein ACO0QE_001533 [Hanseniaspora vineae]
MKARHNRPLIQDNRTMSFTTLPDMRFASTIRNSFQNQYNTIIKKRLAQEGKLGTTEIKPFALEQDNYLRARVIGTVVLKQVIVMPFLQSAIYAELLILSRPWLIMIVRNGVRAGTNVKSWIDKFILLRNPQAAV